jgi:histidinol-phosphate aminotransferase
MSTELTSLIDRVRQPFNINALALAAASAAIDDRSHLEKSISLVRNESRKLSSQLEDAGFKTIPGHTNFMLVHVNAPAQKVYENMLKEGVITRAMNAYGFPEHIRHTIGLPDENMKFVAALLKVTSQ